MLQLTCLWLSYSCSVVCLHSWFIYIYTTLFQIWKIHIYFWPFGLFCTAVFIRHSGVTLLLNCHLISKSESQIKLLISKPPSFSVFNRVYMYIYVTSAPKLVLTKTYKRRIGYLVGSDKSENFSMLHSSSVWLLLNPILLFFRFSFFEQNSSSWSQIPPNHKTFFSECVCSPHCHLSLVYDTTEEVPPQSNKYSRHSKNRRPTLTTTTTTITAPERIILLS